MKNLLITLFALFTLSASAGVENMRSNYSALTDTCVNTGTAYLDITLNNVYQSLQMWLLKVMYLLVQIRLTNITEYYSQVLERCLLLLRLKRS